MSEYNYTILENKYDGLHAIKLTSGPFEGIIYAYGKVSFDEDEVNNKATIAFEYEIIDNANKGMTDMKPFEKYIGKILEELIHIGIQENNLTYTGGVDENRANDSDESDTR
jgi:hypothetical protein